MLEVLPSTAWSTWNSYPHVLYREVGVYVFRKYKLESIPLNGVQGVGIWQNLSKQVPPASSCDWNVNRLFSSAWWWNTAHQHSSGGMWHFRFCKCWKSSRPCGQVKGYQSETDIYTHMRMQLHWKIWKLKLSSPVSLKYMTQFEEKYVRPKSVEGLSCASHDMK